MKQILEVTVAGGKRVIMVDVSKEACKKRGFLHGEIAIDPNGFEVKIVGVALANDGVTNVLWYEIIHPRTRGFVCYWGGKYPDDLIKAGFVKKVA